jgi:hypothetical protein
MRCHRAEGGAGRVWRAVIRRVPTQGTAITPKSPLLVRIWDHFRLFYYKKLQKPGKNTEIKDSRNNNDGNWANNGRIDT